MRKIPFCMTVKIDIVQGIANVIKKPEGIRLIIRDRDAEAAGASQKSATEIYAKDCEIEL